MSAVAITGPGRLWLLGLLVVWAVLLFGGAILGKPVADRSRRMPTWMRMGSSLVLVIAAWSWFFLARGSAAEALALPLAVGMSLGFLADLMLAELLPIHEHVMVGMGTFALGHVAYIAGILLYGNRVGLNAALLRWGAWAVWLLVGLAGWYFVMYRGQRLSLFHKAALPYALLLSSTAGAATGLAVQQPRFIPLALGATLFLLSDLILAAELVNRLRFDFIHDLVWLTYGPGQMLIVYSVGLALTL